VKKEDHSNTKKYFENHYPLLKAVGSDRLSLIIYINMSKKIKKLALKKRMHGAVRKLKRRVKAA
jgi:hypothetical protein